MKKMTAAGLILALAVSFSACGAADAPVSEKQKKSVIILQTEESRPETVQPPETVPAESTLPQTMEVELVLEGIPEMMTMELWDRGSYSIYFPSGGWMLETDVEDGFAEDEWENIYNEDVSFTVLQLGDMTLAEAEAYLLRTEGEYGLQSDSRGRYSGLDGKDLECMDAEIRVTDKGTFLLTSEYALEAADGLGTRMQAIFPTFETK